MEVDFELIFGLHSIAAALKNTSRVHQRLVATDEGLMELQRKHQINPKNLNVKIELQSSHQLQESGKRLCMEMDVEFSRVPSQIFLQTSPLQTYTIQEFLKRPESRLLALDQITDVQFFTTGQLFCLNTQMLYP